MTMQPQNPALTISAPAPSIHFYTTLVLPIPNPTPQCKARLSTTLPTQQWAPASKCVLHTILIQSRAPSPVQGQGRPTTMNQHGVETQSPASTATTTIAMRTSTPRVSPSSLISIVRDNSSPSLIAPHRPRAWKPSASTKSTTCYGPNAPPKPNALAGTSDYADNNVIATYSQSPTPTGTTTTTIHPHPSPPALKLLTPATSHGPSVARPRTNAQPHPPAASPCH